MAVSVELIVAIFAGLVSLVTALGAIIIAVYNGKLAKDIARKAEEDALDKEEQLKEIHVMVNSNLEEAKQKIKSLEEQVLVLMNKKV